jgi:hypothetical protein
MIKVAKINTEGGKVKLFSRCAEPGKQDQHI